MQHTNRRAAAYRWMVTLFWWRMWRTSCQAFTGAAAPAMFGEEASRVARQRGRPSTASRLLRRRFLVVRDRPLASSCHHPPPQDSDLYESPANDPERRKVVSPQQHPPASSALRQCRERQLRDASKLQLAPMMDYTDRHFRHLVRLLSSHTLLYTEMIAAPALAHERRQHQQQKQQQQQQIMSLEPPTGDLNTPPASPVYMDRFLSQGKIEPLEGPSVLQLGGSDPQLMYEAVQAVLESQDERGTCNYTALNLNCGCPSPKVAGKGCFGAALMDDPKLVSQLTNAMYEGGQGQWPISVKCRIGTDTQLMSGRFRQSDYRFDPQHDYHRLCEFVETIASDGIVTDFGIHARIAVLSKSFSPADNRKIPPLEYDIVHQLVHDYPHLRFTLNGGIETLSQVLEQLQICPNLSGVMVGRAWAADPWSFAMADELLYGRSTDRSCPNRWEILQAYGQHADYEESRWDPIQIRRFLVKAISPLFTGEPNAKKYRIALDEIASRPKLLAAQGKTVASEPPLSELIVNAALQHLSPDVLLKTPQDSYQERLWHHEQRQLPKDRGSTVGSRNFYIAQWQTERKQDVDATYNRTLLDPLYPTPAA